MSHLCRYSVAALSLPRRVVLCYAIYAKGKGGHQNRMRVIYKKGDFIMASFTGKVVGGSLNLRASCSTGSSALASIPNNTTLTVNTVSGQNDWFQTSFNGTSGYVVAQYIAVTSGTGTCTVTTASDPLNIRKTPSTSATVIYRAAKGATLSLRRRLVPCQQRLWYWLGFF